MIDEGKVLAKVFKEVTGLDIKLSIGVDSKDLFDTLLNCRLARECSMRGDVSSIFLSLLQKGLKYDLDIRKNQHS